MGHFDDIPWLNYKNRSWHLQGKSADVVILDEYTENLGDALNALNAHMADSYKQSALDKLFGVKP
jgi:hypothetical protein